MRPHHRIAIALLLTAATGCGLTSHSHSPERKPPAMNMQQGADRADVILGQTLSAIKPELRWLHGPSTDASCGDDPNAPEGTGTVDRRIQIQTIVSEARRGSLLGIVERDWRARGYRITNVNSNKRFPSVVAFTPDNFSVEVSVGGEGQFFFSVTTPCFTRTAVAAPATRPNTAEREGQYPLRPHIHDDFWSAPTPGGPSPQQPSPNASR
ncbi:hypothetical protein [Streptomyces sp. NBC_00648]|uniref:hypothetical protein n=1 Tax=Streptomyces sp. NBC_00648 TaxID=2975797 RepID=UPI002F90E556